jgi:hypothetical protein
MTDFAFRDSSRPVALSAPAEVRKSRTGLWSGELHHPTAHTITLGHFSKPSAKQALNERALKAFGRVPTYVHEDD